MKDECEFELLGTNAGFGNERSSFEPWAEVFDPACCPLLKNTEVLWVGNNRQSSLRWSRSPKKTVQTTKYVQRKIKTCFKPLETESLASSSVYCTVQIT